MLGGEVCGENTFFSLRKEEIRRERERERERGGVSDGSEGLFFSPQKISEGIKCTTHIDRIFVFVTLNLNAVRV